MGNKPRAYIAGMGALTAIGANSMMNYCSVKAGISGYQETDYFTQHRERMNMALVPGDALPPLQDTLNVRGKIPYRYRRILGMCHAAAAEAMAGYNGGPIPLIFAAPANDTGLKNPFPTKFIHYLIQQSNLPIDLATSRLIGTGRSGVLEALDLALRYLYETNAEYVLIGGGDSYQDSELLTALDCHGRIVAPGVTNGFVPGEGAGFILLTKNPAAALSSQTHIPSLHSPGLACEPGHLFAAEPYKGEGLAQAFSLALAGHDSSQPIDTVYSSMNGEHYWAKEYGVARIRHQENFTEDCTTQHPADCYGDLGAATGAILINLAVQAMLTQRSATPSLIYCSSDHMYRAATCLEPIPLAIGQQPQNPQNNSIQPRTA